MRALAAYNLLALATCAGLGYWAYAVAQMPIPPLPAIERTATLVPVPNAPVQRNDFRMPPKNAFNQLVTRPPFSPTRRPPRAEPAAKPVVQKPPPPPPVKTVAEPQVTLVGILIKDEKSFAMVRKPGATDLLRLAKGATLDGWLVEGVLPDRLLLSHGDKLLELELTEAAQKGAPAERGQTSVRPRRQ